jgi:hypothetical protein
MKLVTEFQSYRQAGKIKLILNSTEYVFGEQDGLDLAELLTDVTKGIRRPEPEQPGYRVNFGGY